MRFVLIVILALSFLPFDVLAQNSAQKKEGVQLKPHEIIRWQKNAKRGDKGYEDTLLKLEKQNSDYFENNVSSLRNIYPFTSFYEPFSDNIVDQMTRHAYTVQTSNDPSEINENLAAYRKIVRKHLVNVGVLNFAITMARVSAKFGDARHYANIRKTIYRQIDTSNRNGFSPDRAFRVVTRDEEEMILTKLGVTVQKTELYNVHNQHYAVYDVTLENGRFEQVFMDITQPVRVSSIKRHLAKKERTYAIPRMK